MMRVNKRTIYFVYHRISKLHHENERPTYLSATSRLHVLSKVSKYNPVFSDSPVSLGSAGSPLGIQAVDVPSPINFPAPGESVADTSTSSPDANMPGSPGCPVVKVKSEYLRGSPSPGTPVRESCMRSIHQDFARDMGSDRASPDSVFPELVSSRTMDDHQQHRSCTPAPTRSSPQSPVHAVSTTPMPQEVTSRTDSPDRGNLSSGLSKEESDNSVFDGGGGNRTDSTTCLPGHRNSPSSQYIHSMSPSPNAVSHGGQPQTSPRPRAPSVPPHLLTHHQFWSQGPGVPGFASQRLLNGVISSAVSYVTGNNGAGVSVGVGNTGNGGPVGGGNIGNVNTTSGEMISSLSTSYQLLFIIFLDPCPPERPWQSYLPGRIP